MSDQAQGGQAQQPVQQQAQQPKREPVKFRLVEERIPQTEGEEKARLAWLKARVSLRVPPMMKSSQGHGYKYAPYNEILSALAEPMREVGLVWVCRPLALTTALFGVRGILTEATLGWSETGEYIGNPVELVGGRMSAMQMRGAFTTYASRYLLLSLLGWTADVDTDAAGDPPQAGGGGGYPQGQQNGRYQRRGA